MISFTMYKYRIDVSFIHACYFMIIMVDEKKITRVMLSNRLLQQLAISTVIPTILYVII